MLGVDLSKFFASTVVFEVEIHHFVRHLPWTNAMNFEHLQYNAMLDTQFQY